MFHSNIPHPTVCIYPYNKEEGCFLFVCVCIRTWHFIHGISGYLTRFHAWSVIDIHEKKHALDMPMLERQRKLSRKMHIGEERKKDGEDVCFICFDGEDLVLCDHMYYAVYWWMHEIDWVEGIYVRAMGDIWGLTIFVMRLVQSIRL